MRAQNPVGFTARVGSIPTSGTILSPAPRCTTAAGRLGLVMWAGFEPAILCRLRPAPTSELDRSPVRSQAATLHLGIVSEAAMRETVYSAILPALLLTSALVAVHASSPQQSRSTSPVTLVGCLVD